MLALEIQVNILVLRETQWILLPVLQSRKVGHLKSFKAVTLGSGLALRRCKYIYTKITKIGK